MRSLFLAAALVATTAFTVPAEAATPPHPSTCKAVAQGAVAPANAGELVATAAIVTFGAEVTCQRDPLTTGPIDHLAEYTGHLSLELRAADGTILCGGNPAITGEFESKASVLVMANHHNCVVSVTNPRRTQPMYVRAYWATMDPYICCADHVVWITPVGLG